MKTEASHRSEISPIDTLKLFNLLLEPLLLSTQIIFREVYNLLLVQYGVSLEIAEIYPSSLGPVIDARG